MKTCHKCKYILGNSYPAKCFEGKWYCEDCWNIGNPNYKQEQINLGESVVQELLKKAYSEIPATYSNFFEGKHFDDKINTNVDVTNMTYNEPEHYHKFELDTITFLQKGFKPEVFMGFAIGHVIKYAQRAEYKNGREDFVKMVDYAKRALDWYDETNK